LALFVACNNAEQRAALNEMTAAADSTVLGSDITDINSPSRKMVHSADISCRVDDVYDVTSKLEDLVHSLNGVVAESRMENRTEETKTLHYKPDSLKQVRMYTTTAYITLRVPQQYADSVMEVIPSMATFIEHRTLKQEDKTMQYLSNALKNEALKPTIADTPLKTEQAIVYNDQKKEQIVERKINNLQLLDDVNYATITVELFQPQKVDALTIIDPSTATALPFGKRLFISFSDGWHGCMEFLLVLIQLWPLWLIVGLLIWGYRQGRKRKWSI
jgi:hypothetical protein